MKLFLIFSIILLVALASTETPPPTFKLLFDDGNYAITESFDVKSIELIYYTLDFQFLTFVNRENSSVSNWMSVIGGNVEPLESFAIESYYPKSDFDSSEEMCKIKTDQHLRNKIDGCGGNIRLRELTEDERVQLQQFKENAKSKSNFEVTYDKKRTILKSSGPHKFEYNYAFESNEKQNFSVLSAYDPYSKDIEMKIAGKLAEKSFTIEWVPGGRDQECGKPGLPDVQVTECLGSLKLSPN